MIGNFKKMGPPNQKNVKIGNFHGVVEQSQRIIDYRLPNDFESLIYGASNAPSTKSILYTQRALHTYEDACKIENVKKCKNSIFKFLNPMESKFGIGEYATVVISITQLHTYNIYHFLVPTHFQPWSYHT